MADALPDTYRARIFKRYGEYLKLRFYRQHRCVVLKVGRFELNVQPWHISVGNGRRYWHLSAEIRPVCPSLEDEYILMSMMGGWRNRTPAAMDCQRRIDLLVKSPVYRWYRGVVYRLLGPIIDEPPAMFGAMEDANGWR